MPHWHVKTVACETGLGLSFEYSWENTNTEEYPGHGLELNVEYCKLEVLQAVVAGSQTMGPCLPGRT